MRIRDLHIEGFGRFTDWRCGPFERPVTLFRGDNEAGKSTLLEFIRRLLFGFPHGLSRSNPYPPLAGGRHGGRLTLVGEAGEAIVVQRFTGAGGGQPELTDPNGMALSVSELQRLLDHHSKKVFQSVFAFTLDELHDEALLNDDQVNGQIYSAGMGAAKLPKALKTLNDEKRALFLQRGRLHKIYDLATDFDRTAAKLNEVKENAADFGRLSSELERIEENMRELEVQSRNNQSLLNEQSLLEQAWPDWNDLHEAEQELSSVPAIAKFPADGLSRLEVLENQIHAAQREFKSSEDAVETARNQAEVAIEHESILDHTSEIGGLEQGLVAFTNDVHDLSQRQAELGRQEDVLTETLRDIGPDWNEERVEGFDLSLVVREEIAQHADRLQKADQNLEQCQLTLVQDQRSLQEADAAQQAAQNSLDAAPHPEVDQEQIGRRRTALRQMQSWLTKISAIEARASDLQAQLDGIEMPAMPKERQRGGLALSIAGFFIGLAFLAGGAALGDTALFMGIAAGVALIGVAAYLFVSRKSLVQRPAKSPLAAPVRASLRKAEAHLQELRSALAQEAESFHLEVVDDAALFAAANRLDEVEAQLNTRRLRTEALEQAKQLAEARKEREQRSAQSVEQAQNTLQEIQDEWRSWLEGQGLQDDLSPTTAMVLGNKVEVGRTQLSALQSSRGDVASMQQRIGKYVAAAEQLSVEFGLAIDRNGPHTAATAVRQLVELRTEVDERVRERESAKGRLRDARLQLQRRQRSLQEEEKKKQDLLQLGGATDAENFRQRAEQHRSRLELERRQSEAMGRLQRLSGPGQPLEDLQQRLAQTDLQAIQEQRHRLDQESQKINQQINELREQRGSTQEKLNQLLGEEESSKLRTERHRLVEAMRGHARAWTVRTIAENLLKEAQAKFERERQPGVLLDAQNFFRNITGGRYERVFSPLGQQEIRVAGPDGNIKQPNELSRGTREQLFLSLRFGLIRELGQRSEPQPVILDDALVNFDPHRGKKAAEAFLDLAETNQVLVFTCHPQIVEWFTKAAESKGTEPPEVVDIE